MSDDWLKFDGYPVELYMHSADGEYRWRECGERMTKEEWVAFYSSPEVQKALGIVREKGTNDN